MHSLPTQHEPVWYLTRELRHGLVPGALAAWLLDPGSLTARLMAACPGGFSVRVLSQRWHTPLHNESKRMGMQPRRMSFIREVYLCCDGQPWVFARTVIPRKTLSGRQKHIARLGSRPLGAVLFADPHMRRDEIEVSCLHPGERMYDQAAAALADKPAVIWGRRSVFYLNDKPLLVNEIFLPGIARAGTR